MVPNPPDGPAPPVAASLGVQGPARLRTSLYVEPQRHLVILQRSISQEPPGSPNTPCRGTLVQDRNAYIPLHLEKLPCLAVIRSKFTTSVKPLQTPFRQSLVPFPDFPSAHITLDRKQFGSHPSLIRELPTVTVVAYSNDNKSNTIKLSIH